MVVANPPYISHDKIERKKEIKQAYMSYEPFADVYCYFIERAVNLQNQTGLLCFITSNSYLRAEYGAPLRKFIKHRFSQRFNRHRNIRICFWIMQILTVILSPQYWAPQQEDVPMPPCVKQDYEHGEDR